jgi:hypothetical protein
VVILDGTVSFNVIWNMQLLVIFSLFPPLPRPEVNKPGNPQEMRDPMDQIREVLIRATETIRTVCKETLQSLVTTFTNMELEIKVIRSPE